MVVARIALGGAAMTLALVLAGCTARKDAEEVDPGKSGGLILKSPAFANGKPIPARHTGDGEDASPPLQWSGVPAQAASLVIICEDPDAPSGTFVHWLIYDIPAKEKGLPEAVPRDEKLANGACQGTNDFGRFGYLGPSPPSGPVHHYHFKLYALSKPTGLKPGASKGDLMAAMKGKVLASAELIGTYRR